jgi:hypothetical protein
MVDDQTMTWVTLRGGPLDRQQRQVPMAYDNPYGNPVEFLRFPHMGDLPASPMEHLTTWPSMRIVTYRRVERRNPADGHRWHEWHHVADA